MERKYQHLLNVARALRFQANLPLYFWGECVFSATHIINRIPTPTLSNKTPFECLFSILPLFHIFVSLVAYVLLPIFPHHPHFQSSQFQFPNIVLHVHIPNSNVLFPSIPDPIPLDPISSDLSIPSPASTSPFPDVSPVIPASVPFI